jgi:large subunit ribosomal protein LX
MERKIFRVKGVIFKRKLLRAKKKKEGISTYRKVVMPFDVEISAVSEKDALEKIYSIYGGVHKVKRTQIKIEEVREISPEEVQDIQLKKFIEAVQNGEF